MAERGGHSSGYFEVMIRRGLHFTLWGVLTVMGAAPSFGQATTSTSFPAAVVLQGFPDYLGYDPDGYYVLVGELGESVTYQQYSSDPYTGFNLTFGIESSIYRGRLKYGPSGGDTIAYKNNGQSSFTFPATGWTNWTQTAVYTPGASSTAVIYPAPPDPYEVAFPDWESASIVIPLGFGFGMVFWAACLAFHVPMRWVRQLADAAS